MGCIASRTTAGRLAYEGELVERVRQGGLKAAISMPGEEGGITQSEFVENNRGSVEKRYKKMERMNDWKLGEVWRVHDCTTKCDFAIKIMKRTHHRETILGKKCAAYNEINITSQLDHPNIVKLHEVFSDRSTYYAVFEYFTGGELFDVIVKRRTFQEKDAAAIIEQCLSGIAYCHDQNVVHRDITPGNLMIDTDKQEALLKITNFGRAYMGEKGDEIPGGKYTSSGGHYVSPEMVNELPHDAKVDVWSIGIILFVLLVGYAPFSGNTEEEIRNQVRKGKLIFDKADCVNISHDALDLISNMLTSDPRLRPSSLECWNHPWIRNRSTIRRLKQHDEVALRALINMHRFEKVMLSSPIKVFLSTGMLAMSRLLKYEETHHLADIFKILDKNGDGTLDREELIDAYLLLYKEFLPKVGKADLRQMIVSLIDDIMYVIDLDNNNSIEFTEFITVCIDAESLLTQDRLDRIFQTFDDDDGGTISCVELARKLKIRDQDAADKMMAVLDTDGDGEVCKSEFIAVFKEFFEQRAETNFESSLKDDLKQRAKKANAPRPETAAQRMRPSVVFATNHSLSSNYYGYETTTESSSNAESTETDVTSKTEFYRSSTSHQYDPFTLSKSSPGRSYIRKVPRYRSNSIEKTSLPVMKSNMASRANSFLVNSNSHS